MTMCWQACQISSGSPGLVLGFGIWDQDTASPHGFHVVSTWFAHGFHMVCTRFAHGLHMSPTWFSCGLHMAPTWFSCGFQMVCTWFAHGFTCPPHGFHAVSTWAPHGFHVVSTWFPSHPSNPSHPLHPSIHPGHYLVHELSRYWQDLHEFKQKHANHASVKYIYVTNNVPPASGII